MEVNPVTGANAAAATSTATTTAANKAKVDYDSFLQLLVAELNNQDPTEPMDSTKYVSQLATFSQVEQAVQSNQKLDTMLTSNRLILAESLIGNKLTSGDGQQSGVVQSVKLTDDGAIAVLQDGTQMIIGSGVTVE